MRRFIWILIVLIVSVWLGLQIAKDPGVAFFSYRNWSMEMPLWFALLSLFLLIAFLTSMIRLFDRVDSSIYRWRNWLKWRRKNKSYSKTNRGLVDMLEAHWKNAEYYLKEGLNQSEAPVINYLALAKSAHEQKAYDRRDLYLRNAHAAAPRADVAIGLTQAQLQLSQGQLEQALATLSHLRSIAPKHGLVLKLLERVYVHLGDWKSVLLLLPNLRSAKVITREESQKLELRVYLELLKSASGRVDCMTATQDVWQMIPPKLKQDPQLIEQYARACVHATPEQADIAGQLVYKQLKKTWDKKLAYVFGVLSMSDPEKQLSLAEKLLKQYDRQAILLLTLGKLSMRCQLWGKAKSYFEESLSLEANRETYIEYGRLLEQLGENELALQYYRDGLLITKDSRSS